MVIISGRSIGDLVPLLGLDPLPEILGCHGLEHRWPDGEYWILPVPDDVLRGLATADDWAAQEGLAARCEAKPGCLALHWRGLSLGYAGHIRAKAIEKWGQLAPRWGLQIKEFNGGIELRPAGINKGNAVEAVLAGSPRGVLGVYLGDDLTDEDAFAALEGRGVGILVGFESRPTRAQMRLRPPGEVLDFLRAWASAGRRAV